MKRRVLSRQRRCEFLSDTVTRCVIEMRGKRVHIFHPGLSGQTIVIGTRV